MANLKELKCKKCEKWFVSSHKRSLCHNPCGKYVKVDKSKRYACELCDAEIAKPKKKGARHKRCEVCRNVHLCSKCKSSVVVNRGLVCDGCKESRRKYKECSSCGEKYFGQRCTNKACAKKRSTDALRRRGKPPIVVFCDHCGSAKTIQSHVKQYDRNFCDIDCAGEYKKWHNRTEAYKAKYEAGASEYLATLVAKRESSLESVRDKEKLLWRCCSWCFKAFRRKHSLHAMCLQCKFDSESLMRKIRSGQVGYVTCVYCGVTKHYTSHARSRLFCSNKCARNYSAQTRKHLARANGPVDKIGLKTLAKKSKYRCGICGIKCTHPTSANGNDEYSMDHIIPLSKGGTHTWDNVQLACRLCNGRKSDRIESGTQLRLRLE